MALHALAPPSCHSRAVCHPRENGDGNPSSLHPRARCTSFSQISNCRSAILPLSTALLLTCSRAAPPARGPLAPHYHNRPPTRSPARRESIFPPLLLLSCSPAPLLSSLAPRPAPPVIPAQYVIPVKTGTGIHLLFILAPDALLPLKSQIADLLFFLFLLLSCSPALAQRRPPQTPLKTRQNHLDFRQNRRTFRQNALTFRQKKSKKRKKSPQKQKSWAAHSSPPARHRRPKRRPPQPRQAALPRISSSGRVS